MRVYQLKTDIQCVRYQRGAVLANRFGTDRVKQVVAVDELPEDL